MTNRLVEHLFFFGFLGVVAYLMWQIIQPFIGALALAAIIATICYPFYTRIVRVMPKKNTSLAAVLSVFFVIVVLFAPLTILGYLLFIQAAAFYNSIDGGVSFSLEQSLLNIQNFIQNFAPNFSLDITGYAQQVAGWLTSNIGTIFAGTALTVFLFFITLIALFYLFRDGAHFTKQLVHLSPLPDSEDEHILRKLSTSVRSIVLGRLTVALIQGSLTSIGLLIFGFEQVVLWGSVAAIGALIPAVGTTIIFIPAVAILALAGSYGAAIGLALWGFIIVGLVDNLIGPYLMSRGTDLHPFLVLLSVLGGIALFGPIGFILGPVTLSLFMVLLELYSMHISKNITE